MNGSSARMHMKKILGIQLRLFNVRNTFSRLIIASLVLILSLIVVLSVILFQSFMNTSLRAITASSQDRLGQNMAYMQFVREHVLSLGLQMMDEPLVRRVGFSEDATPEEAFRLLGLWRNVIGTDNLIHSICLYNARTDVLMTSLGSSRFDNDLEPRVREGLRVFWENSGRNFVPVVTELRDDYGKPVKERLLSVFFMDRMLDDSGNAEVMEGSALVLNLRVDFLVRNMRPERSNDRTNFLILNSADQVIYETGTQGSPGTLFATVMPGDVARKADTAGSDILPMPGGRLLLVAAKDENAGWRYVSLARFSDLFEDMDRLRTTILFVCLAVFLLAFILSVLGAYNLYLPFDRLLSLVTGASSGNLSPTSRQQRIGDAQILAGAFMDMLARTNELELTAKQVRPMLRKVHVRRILNGEGDPAGEGLVQWIPREGGSGAETEPACLFALVICIDGYRAFATADTASGNANRRKMESAIAECVDPLGYDRTDFEDGTMLLIGYHHAGEAWPEKPEMLLRTLQASVHARLGWTISCTAGFPVDEIGRIADSCSSARERMKYRFVHGAGYLHVCTSESVEPVFRTVSIERNKARLLQAVRSRNAEQADMEIDKICMVLENSQYDYIRLMLNQVALDLVHAARHALDEETEMDANHLYDGLNQRETLQQACDFLKRTSRELIDMLERKNSGKRTELVRDAVAYMERHYENPDLNLGGLADAFKLTPGYFGKLFAEETGKSVGEYLMSLRLDKARELLEKTRWNVQDIAVRVGFANVTYFITVFKRQHGCTPNQYRMERREDG